MQRPAGLAGSTHRVPPSWVPGIGQWCSLLLPVDSFGSSVKNMAGENMHLDCLKREIVRLFHCIGRIGSLKWFTVAKAIIGTLVVFRVYGSDKQSSVASLV